MNLNNICTILGQSQWLHSLRHGSEAARLLGLRVWIPPGLWMCLSLLSVVCCQVKVCVSGWSLVQRIPTECSVSNWVWSWSLESGEEDLAYYRAVTLLGRGEKKNYYIGSNLTACSSDTGVWTWLGVLMVQPEHLWDSVAVALFRPQPHTITTTEVTA